MPFTYNGVPHPGATTYKMTDNNMPPALVLWLLVTTNPKFVATQQQGGLSDADKQQIADQLGITKPTVDYFIAKANSHANEFSTVRTAFFNIGNAAGYGGVGCPKDQSALMTLAPSAKVADPSK